MSCLLTLTPNHPCWKGSGATSTWCCCIPPGEESPRNSSYCCAADRRPSVRAAVALSSYNTEFPPNRISKCCVRRLRVPQPAPTCLGHGAKLSPASQNASACGSATQGQNQSLEHKEPLGAPAALSERGKLPHRGVGGEFLAPTLPALAFHLVS